MGLGTQVVFGLIAACIALHYSGRSKFIFQSIDKAVFGSYGCVPAAAIEELTLQYFPTRGRAEGIRMILKDNNVPYSELNFSGDEWPEIKKKGIETGIFTFGQGSFAIHSYFFDVVLELFNQRLTKENVMRIFTFGQVPAITTKSGISLVQSIAIIHYIGRSLDLDCNCEDYNMCEVIALGTEDLRSRLSKVLYDRNFTIEKRNVYITDVLPTWLAHFERLAPEINHQESNDSFFIADRLTWIDYLVFELIDSNVEFSKSTVPFLKDNNVGEDILENFPRLKNFYETFSRRPQLEKYLVSKSRRAFKLPFPPTIVETKTF